MDDYEYNKYREKERVADEFSSKMRWRQKENQLRAILASDQQMKLIENPNFFQKHFPGTGSI